MEITDLEIESVEKVLLPAGCVFNNERRNFIRCLDSRDAIACPGSGKTTTLLAKIFILSSKMPFKDNRGICVLTHTNVAIDEIKAKLGNSSRHLFQHPNFFGTIQSFVNRFLTIPGYKQEFGRSLQTIDSEKYNYKINEIFAKNKRKLFWLENRGGAVTLGNYWFEPEELNIVKDWNNQNIGVNHNTPTYKKIKELRNLVLEQGILSYNDAYALALRYIIKYPIIVKAFYNRFAFVFIDEMQDTDYHQLEVIKRIFSKKFQVIQCVGDPNQAIYSKVRKDMLWKPEIDAMHFSESFRFGSSITRILHTVRVDCQITLSSALYSKSYSPYIIEYNDDTILKVLDRYAELIKKNNLDKIKNNENQVFKAIGWIGKDKVEDGKICIKSYLPEFQKSMQQTKSIFNNMISYLCNINHMKDIKDSSKVYWENILNGFLRILSLSKVTHPDSNRPFTIFSLLKWIHGEKPDDYKKLIENMAVWIIKLKNGTDVLDILTLIRLFIKKTNIFNLDLTKNEIKIFFRDTVPEILNNMEHIGNVYTAENGIKIEIGTVHSVKGQTHTATLLMETQYYGKTESQYLLEFLKGEYSPDLLKKVRHVECLKVSHVAFSRPTHLLVFACHEKNICGQHEFLMKNSWIIKKI